MNIGTYIKLILQKKNMTQEELARKSGIPKTHISQIIRGAITISFIRARKIEKALGLRKYELVEIVGFPTNDNDKRRLERLE